MTERNVTSDYIVVGQIGSTYGIKGWLKILSYTEMVDNIMEFNPWYLEENHHWKAITVEDGKIHGKGIIAKLAGCNNPEDARLLSGTKIAIRRSQLPKLSKDEYYWNDLQGLTVINQHGETLGKIIYLMATGANDVLVVKGTKEHAIPYLPGKVVTSINLAEGVMHVDWEVI
jgi:16S rRNA processing protein RimM